MRESAYAGWLDLGAGIFALVVLGTSWRFAGKLIRPAQLIVGQASIPTRQPVDLRRSTPHNTTDKVVRRNKVKNPQNRARPNHRRPRNR